MSGGPPGHVDPRRRRVGFASPLIVEFRALRTLNARLACAAAEKEMRPAEHHPECLECSADFIYDYDKQEGEWGASPTSMPTVGHLSSVGWLCVCVLSASLVREPQVQMQIR